MLMSRTKPLRGRRLPLYTTYTYSHNWPLQLRPNFLQMLCASILYVSDETYSLTSTLNHRFLRNFFMVSLFTLRVSARNPLRGNRLRNNFFLYFILMSNLGTYPGFTFNKSTHYLLDYGDFTYFPRFV